MLVVSGTSRQYNRQFLADEFRQPRIVTRLSIQQSRFGLETASWHDYWLPVRDFFAVDARLVQRLNRLKRAWLDLLRYPNHRHIQTRFCWRYFGLLHHSLSIARTEPERGDPLPALQRLVGFESFPLEIAGQSGRAAGVLVNRNPIYLLGQLPGEAPPPTPRHVPMVIPAGLRDGFYYYRQAMLDAQREIGVLLSPAVDLRQRAQSFLPIDRFTRLVSDRADPYWKPRARLLSKRVLLPLFQAWQREDGRQDAARALSILDLGAGTGHLVATSWRYLHELLRPEQRRAGCFHFVDSAYPIFGRSFGLSRSTDAVAQVEWTTADYRILADDDEWLKRNGPFDWVFACRLLDNASNFMIEPIPPDSLHPDFPTPECLPHYCLSPRQQPEGIAQLRVRTARRKVLSGICMPQVSLNDFFAALLAVQQGTVDVIQDSAWYLPVRRFNPASLITPSGRSLIGQLCKVARAIVIEDVDLDPEHLLQHREQFGLPGTAAVHCVRDGFATESRQFVIGHPCLAEQLRGDRLW